MTAPPSSSRMYRGMELLETGLRCVLCVEKDSKAPFQVAATVGAGQLRDLGARDGLSHLTEHLTMASLEGTVLALDGTGYSNAFTGFDRTTFYASCDAARWRSAIRAFASAFPRQPRFDIATAQREIGRVDSELLRVSSTQAMEFDLLVRRVASSDCGDPLARFGPGSRESILGDGTMAQVVDAANALYQTRYRAKEACVCIVAPSESVATLDELESVTVDAFRDSFAGRRTSSNTFFPAQGGGIVFPNAKSFSGGDFSSERREKKVCPFPGKRGTGLPSFDKDANSGTLVAVWRIPYADIGGFEAFESCKPHIVAAHLIGHGGPQTMTSKIPSSRSPGWPSIAAGAILCGDKETGFVVFEVRAILNDTTDEAQLLRIIDRGFEALRQWPRSSFADAANDCIALAELQAWRYPPREPTAVEVANDMRKSPNSVDAYLSRPRRILASPSDAGLTAQKFFKCLDVAEARIALVYDRKKGLSKVRDVDSNDILNTRQTQDEDFFFQAPTWPRRNRYATSAVNFFPSLLQQKESATVISIVQSQPLTWHAPNKWHLATGRFANLGKSPLASLIVFLPLTNDLTDADVKYFKLYFQKLFADYFYDAVLAGHKYELSFLDKGLRFALAGYSTAAFDDFALDYAKRFKAGATASVSISKDDSLSAAEEALLEGKKKLTFDSRGAMALVSGDLGAARAANIAKNFIDAIDRLQSEPPAYPAPSPPPFVLLKPAKWDHPIAQSFGLASGVPALVPGASSRFDF